MKKRTIAFIMAMICLCMTVSASAVEARRASSQIVDSSIQVMASGGRINVELYVRGNGTMDKLGCESIEVYEQVGTRWEPAENFYEDDDGMSVTNSLRYRNTISCNAEQGVEYKVEVTVFAENDAGRDTRSQTFYVTGK